MFLHMKLFADGQMPLRMAEKRQMTPLTVAMDEHHKWNVLLNVSVIFHARQLLQKLESLQQVCIISSPTAWGKEKFVQSGFHTCWIKTSMPHVCRWPSAHFHQWRREGEVFLSPILTVDDSWMNSYDSEL